MTATTTRSVPDVHEMVVIHRLFRRELRLLPDLIRATGRGDLGRARDLAGHAGFVFGVLHTHHTGEDELLWPKLAERAAPSAELVHTMEAQHEVVDRLLGQAGPLVAAWAAAPGPATAEPVLTVLDDLRAALLIHLDLEEREILPLVARHLTVAEWAQLGEHGRRHTPRQQLPLVFGAILEEADDAERAVFLAAVPAPVRFFLTTAGALQYRRYVSRVRGR